MCRFTWFSFLFPTINNAINRLSYVVRSNGTIGNLHYPNYIMSEYSTVEAVEAIDGAAAVVVSLKASLATALESLAPLVAENASLKEAQDILVAADAEVDAAIARLAAVASSEPVEEEVVTEE